MRKPKYQIFCDRGNGLELDGCWGSEHAKFASRREAVTCLAGLSNGYPDCAWVVGNLDGSRTFDRIERKPTSDLPAE